jgi:hypothetical protein
LVDGLIHPGTAVQLDEDGRRHPHGLAPDRRRAKGGADLQMAFRSLPGPGERGQSLAIED